MKCKECGAEVANVGQLNKHKKDCPAKNSETPEGPAIIPWHQLPDQARAAAINGHPVRLAVMGRWTPDGVVVDETDWWR